MKTKLLLLFLCFFIIKANAQNDLTVQTYFTPYGGTNVKFNGSVFSMFTSLSEDGVQKVGDWLPNKHLSDLPTTVAGFNNCKLVYIDDWMNSMTVQQADALINYVKQGGVLVASLEGTYVGNPANQVYALKYIGEALFCDKVTLEATSANASGANPAISYHSGNGILKLNSGGANLIPTSASMAHIKGVPSENAILISDNAPSYWDCSQIKVLEMIIPAYPKMGTAGVNNSCNIQGFAILSGELQGPLTDLYGRINSQLSINYAQFIYDFYYDIPALQARFNWAGNECVNQSCLPKFPNGSLPTSNTIPTPVIDPSQKTIINSCPNLIVSADLNATVTSPTPAGIQLVWFTNSQHIGTPYSTPTNATKGLYYGFYYYPLTGCYSAPALVSLEEYPCDNCRATFTNPTNINFISSIEGNIHNKNYSGKCWITSDIIIDDNVNFYEAEVLVEPNVSVLVTNQAALTITSSHFYTCQGVWNGFKVEKRGNIKIDGIIQPTKQTCSFIEDANIAVDCSAVLPQESSAGFLNINNTIFNRNNISILIKDFINNNSSTNILPFSIKNSLFTCRSIQFQPGLNIWDNLKTVSHNFYGTYPATPDKYSEPYIINSSYPDDVQEAFLKDPNNTGYTTNKPLAGIAIDNISCRMSSGTLACVRIGEGNGSDAYPNTTIFDNLQYGIKAQDANLIVNNCSFQKPIGDGIGIEAKVVNSIDFFHPVNGNFVNINKIQINTPIGKPNNAFFDMKRAIVISDIDDIEVSNCDIRSNQDITSLGDNGKYGISIYNNTFSRIEVLKNKIYNIRNAINYGGGAEGGRNLFGTLNIDDNIVGKEISSAYPMPNGFVENAITAGAFFEANYQNPVPFNLRRNHIYNAYNGIWLSGWVSKNFNLLTNEVQLDADATIAPTAKHYGIKVEGGSGADLQFQYYDQYGDPLPNPIPIGNTGENLIQDNKVWGAGISTTTDKPNAGIWLSQQNNTYIGCNHVWTSDNAYKFEGANLLTKFMDNYIYSDNHYGFTLYDGGEIGKQGQESLVPNDPNTCTSNNDFTDDAIYWNGQGQKMTYTENSDPLNSILVVRIGVGYEKFNPAGSGDAKPTFNIYGVGNGLLTTSQQDGAACDAERCINHPYYRHIKHSIIELLEEIAAGTASLPNDEPLKRLEVMQQQLYDLAKKYPELAQNSSDIQQFIYDNQWSSLDFIYYAGYYANRGDMDMVNTLLGYWTPTNSELDNNYHTYYEWLVQMYNNPEWKPSIDEVLEMANKCPIKDGSVIYAARNLYNALTREIHKFDNACEGNNSNARGIKKQTEIIRLKQPKVKTIAKQETQNIVVYPNPASSVLFINCNNIKQIEVINTIGVKALQKQESGITKAELNISSLQKGIYLIRVTDVNNKVHSTKFIKE